MTIVRKEDVVGSNVGSTRFREAVWLTINLHEGGFSDDARDPGGKTRYGITERVARDNGYNGPMRELPLFKALEIYFDVYWRPMRLMQMESYAVSAELFDTAVNIGRTGATKVAQDAINLLNRREGRPLVARDGLMGPRTAGELDWWTHKDHLALLAALNGYQFVYYLDILKNNPSLIFAIRSWLRRTLDYSREI